MPKKEISGAKHVQPCFVEPMQVAPVRELPDGGAWLKYKINQSQEFVIGGYTTAGNPFDALIVGCYEGSKLKFVAKVRNGFVPHIRCAMYPRCSKCARTKARLLTYRKSGARSIR